jgi:hypothetical protein
VREVRRTERGFTSDLTAVVECERGPFFVKAVRNKPGGRLDSLVRERLVNPHVQPISPALRWQVADEAWVVLGFELVEGRFADFAPGSEDLPAVVELLSRVGRLQVPEVAHDWVETRWDRYTETREESAMFRGSSLLHTDINPDNLLIGERASWAVDWSWPTVGAGFIDPAILVVQLIAAGHTPASAESWVAHCPAWVRADRAAIDAYAAATVRMYRRFVRRSPDASWLGAMLQAATGWADHRGVTVNESAARPRSA